MGRNAPCPDCKQPVSVVSAITVVRGGSVVLLCPECANPASASPIAPSVAASEPEPVVEPGPVAEPEPVLVRPEPVTVAAEPVASSAPASQRLSKPPAATGPTPDEGSPARRRRITPVSVADITGEIALHSEADASEPSPTPPRWRKPAAVAAVIALVALVASQTRGPDMIAAKSFSAAYEVPDTPLSRVRVDPSERSLYHELSVAFSDEQAALPWVHPIAAPRQMPDKDDRRFGASRPGDRPLECGAGHCGVDLGGGRGTVIHAALGGRLIRVKRDAGGASGRYVAIEHPQGLRSHYMHLDRVHPNLVVGAEVASGEAIGTLGSTGVRNSPPHLHFTVHKEIDGTWLYVDPEPMLYEATLLDEPGPMPEPSILSVDVSKSGLLAGPSAKPTARPTGPTRARPERARAKAEPTRPHKSAAPAPGATAPRPAKKATAPTERTTPKPAETEPAKSAPRVPNKPATADTIEPVKETSDE